MVTSAIAQKTRMQPLVDGGAEAQVQSRMSLRRHRDFMFLWGGQAVSQSGSAITTLALPLTAVVVLRASTFTVGLLSAATYAAFIFIALPAGVIVNRLAKRRLMIWCDVARLLIIASIPLAAALGVLSIGQLFAAALTAGVFSVFFDVANQSYVPTLVGPPQLTDANGKLGASRSFAQVAGPGLGGGLVAAVGVIGAVTVDGLSYAVSVASLLAIRQPEERPERAPVSMRRCRAEIAAGLVFVGRHPILRRTTACTATGNLFIAMEMALDIVFLVRVLHVRPGLTGVLIAAGSLGGVAGGALAGPLARRIGSARIMWIAPLVIGAPSVLVPLAEPGWRVVLFPIGYGISAFSCVLLSVAQLTYRQLVCPPELRASMNAATRWIIWGVMPLGGLLGGALGDLIGVRPSMWLAILGTWAAGFWIFFSPLRSVRDLAVTAPGY
jgi:MFS family permease